jgi:acyl carrier protein
MHAVGADMIPAEYEGLEEQTVAVVTLSDGSQYSNDSANKDLGRRVSAILTKEVDKIRLVREEKIDRYRDVNGWDSVDFAEIGMAVGADKVVGIELDNLRLRDGATLYRGRADVTVHVIDVASGTVEYTRNLDEFTYPTVAGQYTSETTESKFRKLYFSMLSEEIGRTFHPYDFTDRLALDSAIAR